MAAGSVLAEILIKRHIGVRPISLIGFSLGARVIFYALVALAKAKAFGIVQDVYLMGATLTAPLKVWRSVRGVVAGRFVNAFARNDWVLGYLFRATTGGLSAVAGLRPVVNVPNIENVDLTEIVVGHLSYRTSMPLILRHLGFKVTADAFDEPEDPTQVAERETKSKEEEILRHAEREKKQKFGLGEPTAEVTDLVPSNLAPLPQSEDEQQTERGEDQSEAVTNAPSHLDDLQKSTEELATENSPGFDINKIREEIAKVDSPANQVLDERQQCAPAMASSIETLDFEESVIAPTFKESDLACNGEATSQLNAPATRDNQANFDLEAVQWPSTSEEFPSEDTENASQDWDSFQTSAVPTSLNEAGRQHYYSHMNLTSDWSDVWAKTT